MGKKFVSFMAAFAVWRSAIFEAEIEEIMELNGRGA
jgi:hypothetical protein